jgi:polyisoprenoid-binding protein YceI
MKTLFTLLLATFLSTAAMADEYTVDPVHSYLNFKVKFLDSSFQYGRFNQFTGSISFGTEVAKHAVSIAVDANSVDTTNVKRDEHLEGPDFFDAKKFPEITFKSAKWEDKGNGLFHVTGELSLHGVTKAVTVPVTKIGAGKNFEGKDVIGFEGVLTVKRSEFNITKNVGPIGDEVVLTVSLQGIKK